jgi:O-antigen/teichoic acid export membrane protein
MSPSLIPRLRYWGRHASATIFDQGFVSGSNFLLGVLLARLLGPERYGVYVLAFSLFLLAAQLHQALILDPMAALQPAFYPGQVHGYVSTVIRIHALLSLSLMPVVAVGALFVTNRDLAVALWGLVPAIPLVLFFWTQRAGMYLIPAPEKAARGAIIYFACMFTGAALCVRTGILSPLAAFCVMSTASLVAALYLWRSRTATQEPSRPALGPLWRRHWAFGKWLIGVQGVGWIQSTCLLFMTGSILGTKQAGVLTAMVAMSLPVQHLLIAAARLLMPKLAHTLADEGIAAFQTQIAKLATISTACGVLYVLSITAVHQPLVRLVYGQKYVEYAHFVPWYMISIALSTATFPFDVGTKVMRMTRLQLYVNCTTTSVAVIAGILTIPRWGLAGVIVTNITKDIIVFGLTRYVYYWASHQNNQELSRDAEPQLAV